MSRSLPARAKSSGKAMKPGEATPAAGFIVYRSSRGFLLLKKDFWEFPKGKVDAQDVDLLATARRELREETGIATMVVLEGFHEHEVYPLGKLRKRVDYWLCTTHENPTISSEHRGFAWCSVSEANVLLDFASKKEILARAVAFLDERGLYKEPR